MKKLLILSLILASAALAVPATESNSARAGVTAINAGSPQVWAQRRGRNWNRRYRRTVIRTRIRWIGPYRYRETVRITYRPNGRVRTQVIRRVRISGRRW